MIDYFLADDLSGALDAAAAFHGVGRRVRIVLSADEWQARAEDDVVGVTTETRNAAPEVAAARVTRAIAHARSQTAWLVYKKIDSTLRGSVTAELEALARAMQDARILFAPANPLVGRIVRRGVLLVHGVPVAETEFGRDPVCPVRSSDVCAFRGAIPSDRILIPDTENVSDLEAAVARMAGEAVWVAVGSGALARPVAAALGAHERGIRPAHMLERTGAAEAVLLVAGSVHPANRAQAAKLAAHLGLPIRELALGGRAAVIREAVDDLRRQRAALVLVEELRRDSAAVLREVTAMTGEIVEQSGVRRVFVTGGETAFALCKRLGVASLDYLAELEPGLGVSRAERGAVVAGDLLLAVKPGGFGDADTWRRAWEALRGCRDR